MLYLEWQHTLYYKFNASDPDELTLRPNDLLMWSGMELAQERGLDTLDLGLSDWDQDGLVRYKRKFATREGSILFLRSASRTDSTHQDKHALRVMGALTELLTDVDVPDHITERAGEAMYRVFA